MLKDFFHRINTREAAVILVLLTLAVFGPFVTNDFVTIDDDYLIYNNPAVKEISAQNLAHVFSTYDPQLYIPLTFVSYQINALFGMTGTAFHIVNLLLHCANAVLLLIVLRKLTGNLMIAAIASALFAIHPIQTEAVLWAAARKDLLSGFFFLLSTLQYLRYRDVGRRKDLWLSIGLFALALLSKVSVIMLPLWLLAIDWLQGRKIDRETLTEKIPYGVLMMIFGLIAVVGKSTELGSSGTLVNLLLPGKSAVFYLQKFFWPVGLSVIYPYQTPETSQVAEFGVIFAVLGLIFAALVCLAWTGRWKIIAFGIATYFLLLAPSFSTFWKNGYLYFASDRYVYLASIGFFVAAAYAIDRIRTSLPEKTRVVVPAAVALIVVALIPLTRAQSAVWRSSIPLYENVLRHYPDSVMAHTNLGLELQLAGNRAEARAHYEKAMELDPQSTYAYFNLASLENEEGHPEKAIELYVKIVDAFGPRQLANPSDIPAFLWLVKRLDDLGKSADSLRLLQKLTELAPRQPEPHHLLGERYRLQGNEAAAVVEFEASANAGSKNPNTYYYLVEAYSGMNRMDEAVEMLEKGVRLDPTNAAARAKLEELKRAG